MNITRDYAATIEDVSTQERMVTARINTSSVDRYRTVIDPMGIDLTAYKANPVVLWEHGKDPTRGRLPIGRNTWIKTIAGKTSEIRARTQFGKDDYSQYLFECYRDGGLRGWSVNVLPDAKRCSPPTKEEIRARPELEDCHTMYRGGELAEYSAVAVTGNKDTLTMLETRGIWFPDEAKIAVSPTAVSVAIPEIPAIHTPEIPTDAGRSLLTLRRELASDFSYMETRLMTRMRDLGDLLKGRV